MSKPFTGSSNTSCRQIPGLYVHCLIFGKILRMHKYLYLIFIIALSSSCTNSNTTQTNTTQKADAPATENTTAPAGLYHVYQLSGAGYGYQYKFELLENGTYKMFDKTGSYTFDSDKKVIHFTSGGLKDFTGIFTRTEYLNENRKLMIVLDFHGDNAVPDTNSLGKKPGGYYQYAYLQKKP